MAATSRHFVAVLLPTTALAAVLLAVGCSDPAPDGARSEPIVQTPTAEVRERRPGVAARPAGRMPADATCVNAGCHASFAGARHVHGVLRTADDCAVCHEAEQDGHEFPLRREGNATCTSCHEETTGQRVHQHGGTALACVACHDPHASDHPALLVAAPVQDICARCHPAESPAHPHGPFRTGECTACHEPHQSDFAGLLRGGSGSDHCFLCHDETHRAMTTARRVHAPALQSCLLCHEPHGGDHPHAMTRAIDETCFSCHADLEKTITGVETPHGVLTTLEQCSNCHDAHASNHPSLLKDRQDVLCLQCHDKEQRATDGRTIPEMASSIRNRDFLHGPVESGNCTACHNIHGSSQSRLLRETFPAEFYASFDLKSYALCFECHEEELVTVETTTALTGFRDGDRNLHYLHVNREKKGRTCRTCHEIHGSDLPAHLAESVPFEGSGWSLPIGFQATETGGSCAPGCHKPMSYRRGPEPGS